MCSNLFCSTVTLCFFWWFFFFRLILICNPLHYKRMVTKRRLHSTYFAISFFIAVELAYGFIFLRRDVRSNVTCITTNVLTSTGYYLMPVLNFVVATVVLTINFLTVVVKMQTRKRMMGSFMKNKNPNASDGGTKITRVTLISLGVYIVLYMPAVVLSCVMAVVDAPEIIITLSVTLLIYFLNNMVNPFIYYFTLKDFRQGYRNYFLCRTTKEDQSCKSASSSDMNDYIMLKHTN